MRGRPKLPYRTREAHVRIKEEVLTVTELILLDPLRGKKEYGELGNLISALLDKFNKEFISKHGTPRTSGTTERANDPSAAG